MKKNKNVPCFRFHVSWKRSFTLVELLIAVTVIIIFSGLSLAYYNQFTEEKKLETETQKLVDVLELAKKKASSVDKTPSCPGDLVGYRFEKSTNQYELKIHCRYPNGNNYFEPIKTYTLPSFLNIQSVKVNGTIDINYFRFNILSAGITIIPNPPSPERILNSTEKIEIVIKSNRLTTNNCLKVTINSSAVIEVGNKYSC